MSIKYQPEQFEQKWIKRWKNEKVYKTPDITDVNVVNADLRSLQKIQKMYCLAMFPYPSGAGLHIGHVRIYTGCDVIARYFRMKGHAVLHPIGWDAFGLPAENAAIKAQKNPMDMVRENIVNFKRQMQSLGLSYDWEKECTTSDPDYYQWTQWLFIQFFKRRLLYKKNTEINFCPFCKTGLAEEEVLTDGTHERCGNLITKKEMPQWIFRITAYADRLLSDLDRLDWPKGILEMQRNWIGKKEGIEIKFKIKSQTLKINTITVFTTTPVNFGATFLAVAPDHFFIREILDKKIIVSEKKYKEIKQYVAYALEKTEQERLIAEKEKTGVDTGLKAINHLTHEEIPVWVSDFVLSTVGTGAVQGCPGNDIRDFEFAKKFNLPIKRVVVGKDGDVSEISRQEQVIEKGQKGKMINSDFLNGHDFPTAMQETMDYFEKKKWGKRVAAYHLRDWIFSRQRYWGEPIPMIYCQACAEKKISCLDSVKNPKQYLNSNDQNTNRFENLVLAHSNLFKTSDLEFRASLYGWFALPEEDLPIKLPYVKSYEPTHTGESPLSAIESFVNTTCPHCGGEARRETDTMPNWAGSCWYFLYFVWQNKGNPKSEIRNPKKIKNPKNQNSKRFENLNLEHSGLFRASSFGFRVSIDKWLPVDWYFGGAEHAVLHLLYARFWVKALYDIGLVQFQEPFLRLRNVGMVLAEDHRKMSKSWGNVVNPDEVVNEYGADALRIYEMFMAPFDSEISWSTNALQGAYRFLKSIWQIYHHSDMITEDIHNEDKDIAVELQKLIIRVSFDITNVKFNTAIAGMMKFLNKWENKSKNANIKNKKLSKNNSKKFLQILAPFAPFITEEIWRTVFGEKNSIHLSSWPEADASALKEREIVIPIQVNGKLRAILGISSNDTSQDTVVKKVIMIEKIKRYIEGKKYKVIYVKGKILNFVT